MYSLLRNLSPVYMDGAGPMPSFSWSPLPAPDLGEYYARQDYYDALYARPYLWASSVTTLIGCLMAPVLRGRSKYLSERRFWGTVLVTLSLLVGITLLSDIGSYLRLWDSALWLLTDWFSPYDIIMRMQSFLPPALLAAAVCAIDGVFFPQRRGKGEAGRARYFRISLHKD